MGTIKFELDIPEFNNTLSINIALTKDKEGVVHYSSPSPVMISDETKTEEVKKVNPFITQTPQDEKKVTTKRSSGNMMSSDIF